MKKLFAVALIAVSFAACNSTETKTEETTGDTTVTVVPQAPDTVKTITDTTVKVKTEVTPGSKESDTTKMK